MLCAPPAPDRKLEGSGRRALPQYPPRHLTRVGVLLACGLGCGAGCGPQAPPSAANATDPVAIGPDDGTARVTITFVDAVLALSHADGRAWDSGDVVPESVRADLRVALVQADAYTRVVERIVAHDAEPWGKPDPVGTITLLGTPKCRTDTRLLPVRRDTYRPSWAPGITWRRVPFDPSTRFRLVLEDEDGPQPNELVGAVDIASEAIEAALAKGGAVHRVDVSAQRQPILFVGMIATRE